MLRLITGPKGSGKTHKAHEILGECVKNKGSAMLIVPKQFTFESDKGILHLLGPRLACEVEVLSFTRLSHIAVQQYGGITKPLLKGGSRLILMSFAIEGVKDSLQTFSRHSNEISLVKKMLSEVDRLKNEGITPEQLEAAADNINDRLLCRKIREIALIYRSFEAIVSQNHFDDADLLKKVYDILSPTDFFKDKTIVIDGFSSFSFYELKLIELMLSDAKDVYVTLCTDEPYSDSMLSVFACVNKTVRKLRLLAGNMGIDTDEIRLSVNESEHKAKDILHLCENIYAPVSKPYNDDVSNVVTVKAPVPAQECDFVARKIKQLIREEKYRCRDIAIVYRSGDEYEKLMRESLKKYGVPLFEDKRQPVINQPLVCFVRSLLSIISEGVSTDSILRYLKTGLTGLSVQEISDIENYVFMWDIDGKKWLSEWKDNPDGFGYEMNEKRKEKLDYINAIRQKITAPVVKLKEQMGHTADKQAIKDIYNYLKDNSVDKRLMEYAIALEEKGLNDLAVEQEQIWDILVETFDELAQAIGDMNVKTRVLGELFDLVIADKSLGKLPDGFDEVYICTADRILTKKAEVVFVLGMNEGVFPLNCKEEGLIFFKEKAKLSKCGIDLSESPKELTAAERFLVYACFAAAQEKLFICYSSTASSGEKLTKSEVVTMTERILGTVKEYDTLSTDVEQLIESEKAAFELMASRWHMKDGKSLALKEYFSGKNEYSGRIESIKRALDGKNFAFENKSKAKELFGKNLYLSASQLEVYGNCPFMYFCRYGLFAKKRQSARLDPAQSGTVVHYVLENILGKYKGRQFLELSGEQLDEQIKYYLNEYIDKNMGGSEDKAERFNYLYFRMHKILSAVLERLVAEFSEGDFEPCDFELCIDEKGDVKPAVIKLKDGSVQLRGVIDRVDKMDLDGARYIRVVDYKTGVKEFLLSDVMSGLNMQMLLYLMSIWKNGSGFYENIIPSGVLYFPARISPYAVSRQLSEEEKRDKRFTAGKMSGMLIGDEEIVAHMEKDMAGRFIPAKIDARSKKLRGNFISVMQLEKLGKKMDEIIAGMGNSLHDGIIPAKPAFGPGHSETCTYCDYKDICMKEDPEFRYIPKMNHEESIRVLMGGEDGEQKLDK